MFRFRKKRETTSLFLRREFPIARLTMPPVRPPFVSILSMQKCIFIASFPEGKISPKLYMLQHVLNSLNDFPLFDFFLFFFSFSFLNLIRFFTMRYVLFTVVAMQAHTQTHKQTKLKWMVAIQSALFIASSISQERNVCEHSLEKHANGFMQSCVIEFPSSKQKASSTSQGVRATTSIFRIIIIRPGLTPFIDACTY